MVTPWDRLFPGIMWAATQHAFLEMFHRRNDLKA